MTGIDSLFRRALVSSIERWANPAEAPEGARLALESLFDLPFPEHLIRGVLIPDDARPDA